jgi:hypothetical protein
VRKHKQTLVPGLNGGQEQSFSDALNSLFEAQNIQEVQGRLLDCQVAVKTLQDARTLHSWVVNQHDLSHVPLYAYPELATRVLCQWYEMTCNQLLRITANTILASDFKIWRALHGLCPTHSTVGRAIEARWNSISGSQPKIVSLHSFLVHAVWNGHPEVHVEVLTTAGISPDSHLIKYFM